MIKKLSLVLASIIFLSFLALFPILKVVGATETTYSPTGTYVVGNPWLYPTNAYTSGNAYAVSTLDLSEQAYTDYGINIGSDTIDKVEIGLEVYHTSGSTGWYYSVNGGSSWFFCDSTNTQVETLFWHDVTLDQTWSADLLSDANFETLIKYQTGSACYGLEAEVGLWEGGLRKVKDLQVGDIVTGWNETAPYEIKGGFETWKEIEFEYIPSTIQNITIHNGTWEVVRLIMESYYRPGDFKDVLVTPDHLLPAFKVEWENETLGIVDKVEMEIIEAKDFSEAYYVFGYMSGGYNFTTETEIAPYFEPYQFHNITYMEVEGVADIQTETEWFMGHYLLKIKQPWTSYVDHVPVRITTTEVESPSVSWHCFYIDLNNTVTEYPTRFWSNWEDLNASEGLSHYLFSWNISGSPQNITWSNAWLNENETFYDIPSLNASVGTRLGFQFYANDSSGVEYESAVVSFLVEPPYAFNPAWFLGGAILATLVTFIGTMYVTGRGRKKSTADRL